MTQPCSDRLTAYFLLRFSYRPAPRRHHAVCLDSGMGPQLTTPALQAPTPTWTHPLLTWCCSYLKQLSGGSSSFQTHSFRSPLSPKGSRNLPSSGSYLTRHPCRTCIGPTTPGQQELRLPRCDVPKLAAITGLGLPEGTLSCRVHKGHFTQVLISDELCLNDQVSRDELEQHVDCITSPGLTKKRVC